MSDLCKEVARMGKGIGNENRYRILEALMTGAKTVGTLAEQVDVPQPTVSQHLRVLKEAELVTDERHGKEIHYAINVAYMTKLLKHIADDVKKGNRH